MTAEMKCLEKSRKLVRFLALDGNLNWTGKQYNSYKNKALKQGDKNCFKWLKVINFKNFPVIYY